MHDTIISYGVCLPELCNLTIIKPINYAIKLLMELNHTWAELTIHTEASVWLPFLNLTELTISPLAIFPN
jgi:hypothetical protein